MESEKKQLSLDDFYFILEESLQARSLVSENLEGLEHLSLDDKTNDPYLLALYTKHGLFCQADIKKSFEMFNNIKDTGYSYESWKTMKIPIQAFVSYHLSLFYLGYANIIQDLKTSEEYLDDSIRMGHKLAMFDRAEEILENNDPFNVNIPEIKRAIELYLQSCNAGFSPAHMSIIECYKLLNDFKSASEHYDILINKFMFENLIPEFYQEYNRLVKLDSEKKDYYLCLLINVLMKSEFMKAHTYLLSISPEVTENLVDHIFANEITEIKLNNLLLLFNNNNLLYQKYMTKLFKACRTTII